MPKKGSGGPRQQFNPSPQHQLGQQGFPTPVQPDLGQQFANASGAYQWMINNRARKLGIDPMQAFQNNLQQHQAIDPNWSVPQFGLGWFGRAFRG